MSSFSSCELWSCNKERITNREIPFQIGNAALSRLFPFFLSSFICCCYKRWNENKNFFNFDLQVSETNSWIWHCPQYKFWQLMRYTFSVSIFSHIRMDDCISLARIHEIFFAGWKTRHVATVYGRMEGNWRVFNRGRQGRTYICWVPRNMKTIIFIWPPHMLCTSDC